MAKKTITIILLISFLAVISSCSLITNSLDNRTGLTDYLNKLKSNIKNDEWDKAVINLDNAKKAWKKLKPLLQINIDHDYINCIEDKFTELLGYIETHEKPDSLAIVLIIEDTWKNINSI